MTSNLFTRCEPVTILSELLVRTHIPGQLHAADDGLQAIVGIGEGDLQALVTLANKHHVVIRALEPFCALMTVAGKDEYAERVGRAVMAERARIQNALSFLDLVFQAFDADGCKLTVMKSLDHWPDLGNDLDLFTTASPARVVGTMREHFDAKLEPRSWGDRMANKWNFTMPGRAEVIEIHVGRLGQTGEHVSFGQSLIASAKPAQFGSHDFVVPVPEHRIILATLQRMYRHFYVRLCDIMNTTELVEADRIDYSALQSAARECGIWPGVASYLCIVSDYVNSFRGEGLKLPAIVRSSATFGGDRVYFNRDFLRIPIVPDSLRLYVAELKKFLQRRDVPGTLRLSVLPGLATAAAVGQKLTGTDKGIW